MENYIVSARKYRPATFDSVVGQKALTATLRNAVLTNRLAHSFLFCGSRGVGKTSCARILAKTINCEHPTPEGNPCNECDSCRAFNDGVSMNIIELDAASHNGVDDIRALNDQVQVLPTNGRYRVFIIDEVHMLSPSAFNAFLKTLEEPPSYVIFILATTEKHKILPTILSRCQIYDFNRITINDIVDHLSFVAKSEGIEAERAALAVIASKAEGAMRDALSIFDQVAASSRGHITYQSAIESLNVLDADFYSRLVDAFHAGDVPGALLIYKDIRDRGFDSHFFVNGLAEYVRDLMVALTDKTADVLLDVDEQTKTKMKQQAKMLPTEFYYAAMSLCNEADLSYRQAANKTFLVELLLIKLCQLQSPSQNSESCGGEGQLKPIAASQNAQPQQVPAPAARNVSAEPAPAYNRAQPQPNPVITPRPIATRPLSGNNAPRTSSLRRGPSLKDINAKSEDTPVENTYRSEARTNPYTPDDVTKAWTEFMATRPGEHILLNTMRASTPQQVNGDTYKITVENHGQTELMTGTLTDIYIFVRNRLSNDNWTLTIEENSGAGSPVTWNDREVLAHLMKNNEAVRNLVEEFKLNF